MLALERTCGTASQLLPLRSVSFIESNLAGKPLQGPRAAVWLSALRWHADDELFVVAIDLSESYDNNRYARKVVVHRNTVAYRLKQVAERYGIDLPSPVRDPELVFQTLLSCKLLLRDT